MYQKDATIAKTSLKYVKVIYFVNVFTAYVL